MRTLRLTVCHWLDLGMEGLGRKPLAFSEYFSFPSLFVDLWRFVLTETVQLNCFLA